MSLIRVLLASLPLAHALKSPLAAPTDKSADEAGLLSGFVPKPTAAPTPAWLSGLEYKRDSLSLPATQTCGFFDHDPTRPNLCGQGSECLFATSEMYFGCCTTIGGCATPLACATYAGGSNAGAQLVNNGSTVLCGSEVPQCQTTIFPTVHGLSNEGPYTHFDCVASALPEQTLFQDTTVMSSMTSSSSMSSSSTTSSESEMTSSSTTDSDGGASVQSTSTTHHHGTWVVVSSKTSSKTTTSTSASASNSSASAISSGSPDAISSLTGAAAPARTMAAGGALALALAAGRMLL